MQKRHVVHLIAAILLLGAVAKAAESYSEIFAAFMRADGDIKHGRLLDIIPHPPQNLRCIIDE